MLRALSVMLLCGLPVAIVGCGDDGVESEQEDELATCEEYTDQTDDAVPVEVVIQNDSADWIYLGSRFCSSEPPLSVSQDGEAVPEFDGSCTSTCGELQESSIVACAGACLPPDVLAIEPGGSHTTTWNAIVAVVQEMPDACYAEPAEAEASCTSRVTAAAGTYEIAVPVYREVECPMDVDCTCTPAATGSCQIPSASNAGSSEQVSSALSYPDDASVTIVVTD